MRGEQGLQRFMQARLEPGQVAHFNRQLGFRRPTRQELAQVSEQGGRVAGRELQEDRPQARAELAHDLLEDHRLRQMGQQPSGMADGFRNLRAEAEGGRGGFDPVLQSGLRWHGVEGGVAFDGRQLLGVQAQVIRRFGPRRVEGTDPAFFGPDRAADIKSHL